ncbi:uncharacterized protein LOC116253436 isoform X1 [Nymphaea colorata]|nr:uncharacterized protein LOC116253436 isoform X1 [Nymphaea colorata]
MAAAEARANLVKLRPPIKDDGSVRPKGVVVINKKVESSSNRQSGDAKSKSVHNVSKPEIKGKTSGSSSKSVSSVKTKSEKKVYTLPGQKYDPPEQREPLRIFYESLMKQRPESEMAEFWMMEHGLLSPERARKAYEKKQKRQKQQRMGTPIKTNTTPIRTNTGPARTNTAPARTNTAPARTNTAPIKTSAAPVKANAIPAKTNSAPTKVNTMKQNPELSQRPPMAKNGDLKARRSIFDYDDDDDDLIMKPKKAKLK